MVSTSIDYLAEENYIYSKLEWVYSYKPNPKVNKKIEFTLRPNKVEMHDALMNPFSTLTDEREFLTVTGKDKYNGVDKVDASSPFCEFYFAIDNKINGMMRKRYNFWQALGDIGGFYDGCRLVVYLMMAPLTRALYQNNMV